MRKQPQPKNTARELAILNAIAEELNSAAGVRQALERTLARVTKLLGLRAGWVWLLDHETQAFYHAASQHLPPYLEEPVRMAGSWCTCIDEFRAGALTPKNIDVIECSRLQPAVKRKATHLTQGLRYHASIPLYSQDKPVGIMNVTGPAWRKLSADELRVLSTIGYYVGVTVERARLSADAAKAARSEERARIAREIHDTLAQGLTAIALQVEGALHQLKADPEKARHRLERALAVSRESLEEARRSVLGLRGSPLGGQPLAEALSGLGRSFTSETGVRVNVLARGRAALPPEVEAELFRIAGEALANVRKHARAKSVAISLRAGPKAVTMSLADDGRGIAMPRRSSPGHGIVGMTERARLVGGALRIQSRAGKGTRVHVTVPLDGA
ncbi:MAG: GAF domain-containing sensor histidine kinase [Candidatus Eremiobacter antarcticus]|nr:GAF domain-containing sensor histidine kinase [Candidatus Eremiobacteraeota bacterium]MBC5807823.1 GAF domain-containing sensor histidine kinase [Candidatus Eremiobacteraeota bacterium]